MTPLVFSAVAGLFLGGISFIVLFTLWRWPATTRSVCVCVLGDLGRSPRMQYHIISLARICQVHVVAYVESRPVQEIEENDRIIIHAIQPIPKLPAGFPKICFILYAPIKVILQAMQLFILMVSIPKPTHFLVQNPPSIPTLPIVSCVATMRGSRFVIDWHNYGHTILALNLGEQHWMVRLAHHIELAFGVSASDNFCVTHAMKNDLERNWGIWARTLHDRPPLRFCPLNPVQCHEFFLRLTSHYKVLSPPSEAHLISEDASLLTYRDQSGIHSQAERPAVIVSSTSYTADEDIGVLLDALDRYDAQLETDKTAGPPILCFITGKGPMRQHYEEVIASKHWRHVCVKTVWLEQADYPKLLGAASLGVSLHTSSSGLDLPMKVVDMFGCGLPVCAIKFNCLGELVKDNINGRIFETPSELCTQLCDLLAGFRDGTTPQLETLREEVKKFRENGWDQNWSQIAAPIFQ
eukprot:m.53437 g.53437  ORF g.53437 m.53437 type:complete len:466 (+) comp18395_c0_seq2:3-1400(+)